MHIKIPPQTWKGIEIAVTAGAVLFYVTAFIFLKPVFGFKLCALLILLASLTIMLTQKQILSFGVAVILLSGSYLMQKIPMLYSSMNPMLQDSGTGFARIFGLLLGLGAIVYAAVYKAKFKTQVKNNLIEIVDTLPGLQTKPKETMHPPVYLCRTGAGKKVNIEGMDRYLHTLLIGSTGTGKTSTVLAPMVWQDLWRLYKGHQSGITVIAPDHEFVYQVCSWCQQLGVLYTLIDLDDRNTNRFNPLEGDPTVVAEIMRTVFRATFGDQDAFFSQAQELHAKNTMLLLKRLRGDDLTLLDVYHALMDIETVQDQVDHYVDLYGEDVITTYFKKEAFGRNKDKLHQFAMGLRLQISDLLTNETVYNVLVGKSDINLDHHMNEGGVLLFNTALGKMGHMSEIFGQFLIMHIQNAVFRRPGTEFTRIPQYLYIDELPVYFNPELTQLLNMGRKYRCACTFTIQGPAQLETTKQKSAMRKEIFNGCRNKIVIGIEDSDDAQLISEMFGETEYKEVREHRQRFAIFPDSYAETKKMKARFNYTEVIELDPWHGLVKTVKNGRNQEPIEGIFEEPWLFQDRVYRQLTQIRRHQILS